MVRARKTKASTASSAVDSEVDHETDPGSNLIFTREQRLETFKDWPFKENSSCSADKMVDSGWHHSADTEADARCSFCDREVTEWEEDDNPWELHVKKADCPFVVIVQRLETESKSYEDMTPDDVFTLAEAAYSVDMKRHFDSLRTTFDERVDELEQELDDFDGINE